MNNPIKTLLYIALFCSLYLIPTPIYTCSDFPMTEDYRYHLFNPNTADLQQYRPFYFTTDFLNDGVPQLIETGINENLKEWANYFENEVNTETIREFLYGYKFQPKDAEYVSLENVKSKSIFKYELVKHLVKTNDKATLDYMFYAKEVEKALEIGGAWTNDELAKPTLQKLIGLAKNTYPQVHLNLQLRYGYQMVVLSRYLEDYKQAVVLFEEFVKPLNSNSIVKYWAMLHHATALYHINLMPAADFNFAMAFKNAPNKRHRAYQGFEGKNVKASLAFAKSNDEKAALWLMKGIKNPGRALESLNNVLTLSPKMPELELLLTREINKLEDWLLTPEYTGFEAASNFFYYDETEKENQESDKNYLNHVADFVDKGLVSGKVHNPAFWHLAAAYLAFMQDNYLKANTHLDQAEAIGGANDAIQNQIYLTRIMAFANDYGGISQEAETQLFQALNWLQKNHLPQKPKEDEYGYGSLQTYDKVMLALAARYEKNGEMHKAAMYLSQPKHLLNHPSKEFISSIYQDYFFYLNEKVEIKDLEKMIEFIEQTDKSDYEQFLTQKIAEDKNRILDLLGTKYLRQDKLEEALTIFEKIPKEYWKNSGFEYDFYLAANPFYANFYSGHKPTEGDTIQYTKPEFVNEMLGMKAIAAEGGLDEAYCNFLIANGYYNMTFYGNSWMYVRYWWTNGWNYSLNYNQNHYDDIANFYGCTKAKSYYEKAAETAITCSFAAMCYRMAGKCDYRQEVFEKTLAAENAWDIEAPQFKDNYYYNLLRSNFAEYYDRLIDDCSSFKDFVAWGD